MWPLLRTWIPQGLTGYRSSNADIVLTRSANRAQSGSATSMNSEGRLSEKKIMDAKKSNGHRKTYIMAPRQSIIIVREC